MFERNCLIRFSYSGYELTMEIGKFLSRKVFNQNVQKRYGVSALNIVDQLERITISEGSAVGISTTKSDSSSEASNEDDAVSNGDDDSSDDDASSDDSSV